jgi:hypothetical protein
MTYTEEIHTFYAVLVALAGAFALWDSVRPSGVAALLWPWFVFLTGFFLFIPVEAHSRTYEAVGWWEALRSVVPEHPATWVRDWLHFMPYRHAIQHKVAAVCMMALGVIEFARGRGRLPGLAWAMVTPVMTLGVAVSLGLHGGSGGHLLYQSEQSNHHVLGLGLVAGAVSMALVRTGRLAPRPWASLWPALVLSMGLFLGFSYRLTPADMGTEGHHHESTGPGMR